MSSFAPVSAARDLEARRVHDIEVSWDGLAILSRDTGGLFVRNVNDPASALDRMEADPGGYYSLGFHFSSSNPPEARQQARFHELKVRVVRAGFTVRARAGFFDRGAVSRPDESGGSRAEPDRIVAQALESPFPMKGIGVELTPLFSSAAPRTYFLNSLIHVAANSLRFEADASGVRTAALRIREVVSDADGEPVARAEADLPVRVPPDRFALVLGQGLDYRIHHEIARPGAYHVRAVVEDSGDNRIGSAAAVIGIPEMDSRTLAVSSILLASPTDHAPPNAPAGAIAELPFSDPFRAAAVRIFRPGSKLTYACIIFDGASRTVTEPRLEVETRLFSGSGQIYSSGFAPFRLTGQTGLKRLSGEWRLNLGSALHPGIYTLQLIVVDRSAEKTPRLAAQAVDFTIQ